MKRDSRLQKVVIAGLDAKPCLDEGRAPATSSASPGPSRDPCMAGWPALADGGECDRQARRRAATALARGASLVMRPVLEEHAYVRILSEFVERRVDAADFMARFRHLCACDGIGGVRALTDAPPDQAGLHLLLASINGLCDTFARSLPSGGGYRVSEEQFRKEVQSLAATLPLAGL